MRPIAHLPALHVHRSAVATASVVARVGLAVAALFASVRVVMLLAALPVAIAVLPISTALVLATFVQQARLASEVTE